MGKARNRKRIASNVEREIQKLIWEYGFSALRIAGSGSSSFPSADLIAKIGNELYIIEVKSTHSEEVRIRKDQLEQIEILEKKFNAKGLIVLKFFHKGIFCTENLREKYTIDDKDLTPFKSFLESKRSKPLV